MPEGGEDKKPKFTTDQIRALLDRLGVQPELVDPTQSKLDQEAEQEKNANHEFWNTQPVPKSSDQITKEGVIHPNLPPMEIPQQPYPLPDDMYWSIVDIDKPEEMEELHQLLLNHYVEDADSMFRFGYSAEFLHWAMKPPGGHQDWLIGVRQKENGELIAFISGIPVEFMVRDKTMMMAEINFLCLNKELRSQRLAPLLIKEVTRRVHLEGIFQAVYTVGKLLPKPVATCRYFHRSLNPKKLMDTGFSAKMTGAQLAKLTANLKLPEETKTGLRMMKKGDVGQVRKLLNRQLKSRYEMLPLFKTDEEIIHWLMPRDGVVWTYVVDDPTHEGKLTDFVSFYSLPSSALKKKKGGEGAKKPPGVKSSSAKTVGTVNAAYLFYYGTKVDYGVTLTDEEKQEAGGLKKKKALVKQKEGELIGGRLAELVGDALVLAKREGFDVFNCLEMMDNKRFTEKLKFGPGDGFLRYYFFNYLARNVESEKVGFVML